MLTHLRNTIISVTRFRNLKTEQNYISLKTKTEIKGKPYSFRTIKC